MEDTYWLKQAAGKPLFPQVIWNKPENRRQGGKLLIIGGHGQAFASVSAAYTAAVKAGIGTVRVILPKTLEKILNHSFVEAEFAPSTLSGSLAKAALAQLDDAAAWADGVLLAGDFGGNSETAILLEAFSKKYPGKLTLSGDAVDYLSGSKSPIVSRPDTLLAADFSKIQKLAAGNPPATVLSHSMSLHNLAEALHSWTKENSLGLLTSHEGQVVAAIGGRVSTTPASDYETELAAHVAVWWLQQPTVPFEAVTSAVFSYSE